MKNIFSVFLIMLLIVSCSNDKAEKETPEIVTTIYPFKVIIQEIVGNRIDVRAILPANADPHTYEMLPSDFKAIQNAKVFFYGSEELDGWAARLDIQSKIKLLDLVPSEFLIDIKVPHKHDGHYDSFGTDPHFWVDPLTVKAMLPNLLYKVQKLFPEHKNEFASNLEAFELRLTNLHKKILDEQKSIVYKNVFSAHPFYSYFFERYGINVVGSIEIAPGHQSTAKEIKTLIDLVKKENVKAIFTHKQHSDKPAKVLAESTGIAEYELDPIGGVSGIMTYEEIILHNFQIIKEALK